MADPSWTSLEIAKLCVSALTPIAEAGLGVYLARMGKRFEHLQWRNQRLIDKRIAIYDQLAPQLNDLLCYFTFVGLWKELSPPEVVALKRDIDKKIYVAAPLFGPAFFEAAMHFMGTCYATFQGWGRDATLRTAPGRRRDAAGKAWEAAWEDCFSESPADPTEVRAAYQDLMGAFAQDIGLYELKAPRLGHYPADSGGR